MDGGENRLSPKRKIITNKRKKRNAVFSRLSRIYCTALAAVSFVVVDPDNASRTTSDMTKTI